jgi:hypothetical protein
LLQVEFKRNQLLLQRLVIGAQCTAQRGADAALKWPIVLFRRWALCRVSVGYHDGFLCNIYLDSRRAKKPAGT